MATSSFGACVERERLRIRSSHSPLSSEYEALGLMTEAFEAVKAETFRRPRVDREAMHRSLVRLAELCQRTADELGYFT